MNLKRPLTFHAKLWFSLFLVFFVATGFVDLVPEWDKYQGLVYWELWIERLGFRSVPYPEAQTQPILVLTIFLAFVAAIVAFILHLFIVMAWEAYLRRRTSN